MGDAWQEFIFLPVGGFIVVLLGTLLLFAEILVKGRMLFGILGILSMSLYFIAHVQEGVALWMGILYVAGILLVVMDGKFIGDGTVGGIGVILMIASLAIPAPTVVYGVAVVAAFIFGALGSLLFLRFIPRRDFWGKLALTESLTSEKGFNSITEGYTELVGKEGTAETMFRPSGVIKIEGKTYSAISNGRWIEKGTNVKVTHVNGTRIMVDPIEDD